MALEKWSIYWTEYSSDAYLYGSEINFEKKDCVVFKNKLMAPGTVIKKWHSKTNFQRDKVEPSLPMIDGEGLYHISIDVEVPENEAYLVRIVFYDKFGNEAGSTYVREKEKDFKCPIKTYSYSIHLVNAGLTELKYHSIVISEIYESENSLKTTK